MAVCFFGVISTVKAFVIISPSRREMIEMFCPNRHIAIEGYYTSANYFMVIRSSDTLIKAGKEYRVFRLWHDFWYGTGETTEIDADMRSWHIGEENRRILIASALAAYTNRSKQPERMSIETCLELLGEVGIPIDVLNNKVVTRDGWGNYEYVYSICLNKVRGRFFEGSKDSLVWSIDTFEVFFTPITRCPEFRGGNEALTKYLNENMRLPKNVRNRRSSRTVYVTFIVERDGSLTDIRVLRGIGRRANEEAIRLVEAMPKWLPGLEVGRPIRTEISLPIEFHRPRNR